MFLRLVLLALLVLRSAFCALRAALCCCFLRALLLIVLLLVALKQNLHSSSLYRYQYLN